MKRARKGLIAALVIAAGGVAGATGAAALSGGSASEVNGPTLTASECPEVAAALERAGVESADVIVGSDECPPIEEIESRLPLIQRDVARMREATAEEGVAR